MKISSSIVFKIISGFATVIAIGGVAGTYYGYNQTRQAQSALAQQTEELESASAKIKELEGKIKELQAKNDESTSTIEKFTQSNKELSTQLEALNKQVAEFEALHKKTKSKRWIILNGA